ncbi:transporter-like protein [Angomonas deanei]|uniref:Major Facilitator Superfamily, putative n=1 Tax=Angomonas deanei TaxID=59799 RepID=A0A7G2CLJ3_9TRYP|nr:transporter-like protein [Angomonas deanei]CAD2219781.1 Major Facilitator Superfamily, putative [Angomonas deanei]|eukprot:EPY21475.1 transporter-like protein [Angomonas deanei]
MLGQVLSSQAWGRVSDHYGRRFPLVVGLVVSGFMMLGFGLSTNLWLSVFFRFMHGLFSGNVHIAKTVIADVTDKTNMAKGFSFVAATFSIGFMVGPVIGSFFYDPANSSFFRSLGVSKDGVFSRKPALLMGIAVLLYSLVSAALCVVVLQESNVNAHPLPDKMKMCFPFMYYPSKRFEKPPPPEQEEIQDAPQNEQTNTGDAKADSAKKDEDASEQSSDHREEEEEEEHSEQVVIAEEHKESFGYKEAFQLKNTRYMLLQYMIVCAADMVMRECFPLMATATVAAGCLGYSKNKIAIVLLINSIPTLISNIFFSYFSKKYVNQMELFRVGAGGAAVLIFLLTLTPYVPTGYFSLFLVTLCSSAAAFFPPFCYSINNMCTAKAAPAEHVGSLMGINQSCGSIMRAIVPVLASVLFAWSISGNHIFPFNHAFVFVLSSLLYVFVFYRSYAIATRDDMTLEMSL